MTQQQNGKASKFSYTSLEKLREAAMPFMELESVERVQYIVAHDTFSLYSRKVLEAALKDFGVPISVENMELHGDAWSFRLAVGVLAKTFTFTHEDFVPENVRATFIAMFDEVFPEERHEGVPAGRTS